MWPKLGEPSGAELNRYATKSSGMDMYGDLFNTPSLPKTGMVVWAAIWSRSIISPDAWGCEWSPNSADVVGAYACCADSPAIPVADDVAYSEGGKVNGGNWF